eukprot:gene25795-32287_t
MNVFMKGGVFFQKTLLPALAGFNHEFMNTADKVPHSGELQEKSQQFLDFLIETQLNALNKDSRKRALSASQNPSSDRNGANGEDDEDRSEWTTEHYSIGTEVSAYFPSEDDPDRKIFSGKVTKYLPASRDVEQDLFHIEWEDGDEQDYDAADLKKGSDLFDSTEGWTSDHLSVGMKVAAYFAEPAVAGKQKMFKAFQGVVSKYAPPNAAKKEEALYRVDWEDGDVEDFSEKQLDTGIALYFAVFEDETEPLLQKPSAVPYVAPEGTPHHDFSLFVKPVPAGSKPAVSSKGGRNYISKEKSAEAAAKNAKEVKDEKANVKARVKAQQATEAQKAKVQEQLIEQQKVKARIEAINAKQQQEAEQRKIAAAQYAEKLAANRQEQVNLVVNANAAKNAFLAKKAAESAVLVSAANNTTSTSSSGGSAKIQWVKEGSAIGTRVAAYFADPTSSSGSQKIFTGHVTKYAHPSSVKAGDQMYHIAWEDGDQEDYGEEQLNKGVALYSTIEKKSNNAKVEPASTSSAKKPPPPPVFSTAAISSSSQVVTTSNGADVDAAKKVTATSDTAADLIVSGKRAASLVAAAAITATVSPMVRPTPPPKPPASHLWEGSDAASASTHATETDTSTEPVWIKNHSNIGVRVAKFFPCDAKDLNAVLIASTHSPAIHVKKKYQKIFTGKVEKYAAPTAKYRDDQLYHIKFSDGDEEDWDQGDLDAGVALYKNQRKYGPTGVAPTSNIPVLKRPSSSGSGASGSNQAEMVASTPQSSTSITTPRSPSPVVVTHSTSASASAATTTTSSSSQHVVTLTRLPAPRTVISLDDDDAENLTSRGVVAVSNVAPSVAPHHEEVKEEEPTSMLESFISSGASFVASIIGHPAASSSSSVNDSSSAFSAGDQDELNDLLFGDMPADIVDMATSQHRTSVTGSSSRGVSPDDMDVEVDNRIAALRCFRVFRLLWFHENPRVKRGAMKRFSPYTGEEFLIRLFAVMQFAIGALTALGNEMFRFTNKTKGGLILMMVFFYSAFVFGAALWVDTGKDMEDCATLGSCMYTMMRLTFFDGTGFDYAYDLSVMGHKWLFCLVMVYMCVTSFGILNGLVGLFGTAFNQASLEAFDHNEEYMMSDQGSFKMRSGTSGSSLALSASNSVNGGSTFGPSSPSNNNSPPPTPNSHTGLLPPDNGADSSSDDDLNGSKLQEDEDDEGSALEGDPASSTVRDRRDSKYSIASTHDNDSQAQEVDPTAGKRPVRQQPIGRDRRNTAGDGGLYGQFKRQASRKKRPPGAVLFEGHTPTSKHGAGGRRNGGATTGGGDILTDARFRMLNDNVIKLLNMQTRMQAELQRLVELTGVGLMDDSLLSSEGGTPSRSRPIVRVVSGRIKPPTGRGAKTSPRNGNSHSKSVHKALSGVNKSKSLDDADCVGQGEMGSQDAGDEEVVFTLSTELGRLG